MSAGKGPGVRLLDVEKGPDRGWQLDLSFHDLLCISRFLNPCTGWDALDSKWLFMAGSTIMLLRPRAEGTGLFTLANPSTDDDGS